MGLNTELIGRSYDVTTFEVTADAIEAYARATNDENERYISTDVVAPPVFPVVPAFGTFMAAGMDPELGADLLRLVHAGQEHVFHAPIRPGDVLTVEAKLESVEQKETGETFTVAATETNQDGVLVAEVRGTMFIRGSGSGARKDAPAAGDEPERDIVYEETTKIDDDQTHRYADASGDHNPIHLDPNVAQMAGLPGIIVHGMCTMAIATKAAVNGVAGGDPTRVRRLSVRLSKPVLPGQELTTKLWKSGSEGGETYAFETYNPDGAAVIKNGLIEIAPA
ncbi:MAG TPA: MaoC/PaaZ C-terminal domain-containing protein [Actinomycetota bacterium]|nr:MaoC/PaaZ C-terminal domain-containing protein [Actinomycetota bacterium]